MSRAGRVAAPARTAQPSDRDIDVRASLATSRRPAGDPQRLIDDVVRLLENEIGASAAAEQACSQPFVAAQRVDAALVRLRSSSTLDQFERMLPVELCTAGGFERVLYSRIAAGVLHPVSSHAVSPFVEPGADDFGRLLGGGERRLGARCVESEAVRRRTSALVREGSGSSCVVEGGSLVVAPVVADDQVVGLIHAQTGGGHEISEGDRVVVQVLADGSGLALERMSLTARMVEQSDQIRNALKAAVEVVDQLAGAPIALAGASVGTPVSEPRVLASPNRYTERLTDREREVFDLLILGATNSRIADCLTVSETTVKSHVRSIFKKLRVSNRAEAIGQFAKARADGRA